MLRDTGLVPEGNVEIVRRVFEMFARRKRPGLDQEEVVAALWHDDARWYPLLRGGGALERVVYEGREGLLRFLREQADEGWSEVKSDPREIRNVDKDQVLVHVRVSAVGAHSGARVGADTWFVFTLRDHKVAEARVFGDEAGAIAAIAENTARLMASANVELVRRGFEAFNRRDWDGALALMADSVTWSPVIAAAETSLLRGKEAIRASWISQVDAVNVFVEPLELIPAGDIAVVAIAKFTGRGRGSGAPFEETRALTVYFEEGKFVRVESHRDRAEALEAAGVGE